MKSHEHSGVVDSERYFSEFIDFFSSFSLQDFSEPSPPVAKNNGTFCYSKITSLVKGPFIFFFSLSVLFFCTPFRQKTKGKMKRMKVIKHKTEDSEVSEDTKSGNLRKLFGLYYVKH